MKKLLSLFLFITIFVSSIAVSNISTSAAEKISINSRKTDINVYYGVNAEKTIYSDLYTHYYIVEKWGKQITPKISVDYNGKALIIKGKEPKGKKPDCEISTIKSVKGENSIASVTVKGINKYKGTIKVWYGIPPKDKPSLTVSSVKNKNNRIIVQGTYRVKPACKRLIYTLCTDKNTNITYYFNFYDDNIKNDGKKHSFTVQSSKGKKLKGKTKYDFYISAVGQKKWLEKNDSGTHFYFKTNKNGNYTAPPTK